MDADVPPVRFGFYNSYARLPARFFARLDPTKVPASGLVRVNAALADTLGLDPASLATADGVEILAGNRVPAGAAPMALAYAGHQFGHFVPQLGDGRAILLGEVVGRDGLWRDIQLKGAGRTPFSRAGDGRAAIGPVLREYIVSEAMAALGVPTSRALAMMRRHGIVPAPDYRLGWSRLSCIACIFGGTNQWASMRSLAPDWFERIARYEDSFGRTIQRSCGIRHLADRERPYAALIEQPDLARRALAHAWDEPVVVPPGAWQLPAGAFGDGTGPS